MLAEQLLSGLLSTYESGGAEFLKSVGVEFAKTVAKDTLKALGEKVVGFFKGKKEAEKEIKLLKHAVNEKDADDFKAQSETVLELLKNAVETDATFAGEVKAIIEGLDEKGQKELAESSGKIINHIATITGSNNNVIQGNSNSEILVGNKIERQFHIKGNYYENKSDKAKDETS